VELDKDGSDSFTLFPLIVQSLRRNLFVQSIYDEKKGWLFQYHKLFHDFLKIKFESEIGDKERNKKLKQEIEENGFAFISPWIYELSGYLMFSRGEFQESIEITKKPFFVLTIGRNLIYYENLRFKFSEMKPLPGLKPRVSGLYHVCHDLRPCRKRPPLRSERMPFIPRLESLGFSGIAYKNQKSS